jgi:glycosyltransferase involved in cell wall biosynthesis
VSDTRALEGTPLRQLSTVAAADLSATVPPEPSGAQALRLSIIIPAYNEEKRIGRTLECVRSHFAAQLRPGLGDIEIIVVNDGSKDGTARLVQSCRTAIPSLRLITNKTNRGKGYSVRQGVRQARGSVILFMDADLSFSMEDVEKLLAAVAAGNDVAIGSRSMDRSLMGAPPPLVRRIAGGIFNRLARAIVGLPFRDTQCGLKAFVRDCCLILFEQQRIEGFGFDPELLFLARRHGLKTAEVAVRSSHDPGSKVRLLHDSSRMLLELAYIWWNGLLDRYPLPDSSQRRRRIYREAICGQEQRQA